MKIPLQNAELNNDEEKLKNQFDNDLKINWLKDKVQNQQGWFATNSYVIKAFTKRRLMAGIKWLHGNKAEEVKSFLLKAIYGMENQLI